MSGWITVGELAAAGDIPTNDREEIIDFLESSKWTRTKEEDGIIKAQLTEAFMERYNRQLLEADGQEERNEIIRKALCGELEE